MSNVSAPELRGDRTADGRYAVSVEEAAAVLGIGRSSAFQAAAAGELPTIRVGRRLLVPVTGLLRLLSGASA